MTDRDTYNTLDEQVRSAAEKFPPTIAEQERAAAELDRQARRAAEEIKAAEELAKRLAKPDN